MYALQFRKEFLIRQVPNRIEIKPSVRHAARGVQHIGCAVAEPQIPQAFLRASRERLRLRKQEDRLPGGRLCRLAVSLGELADGGPYGRNGFSL